MRASTTHSIRSDSLYGSYIYNIQADDTVPTFVFDTRGNRARAQNASLTEMHVFSSAVVNEVRAGWHRFFEHEFFGTTDNPEFDIANIIGIPGVSNHPRDYGAPAFTAGYVLPYGPDHRPARPAEPALAGVRQSFGRARTHTLKIGNVDRPPQLDVR